MNSVLYGDKSMTKLRYQKIFMAHMDLAVSRLNIKGKEFTAAETMELLRAVCEEIRREYQLSDSAHDMYRDMILVATFGKGKGRK